MSACRVCYADITWAITESGEKIPIDDHEERDYGADRYVIIETKSQPVIRAIAEESPTRAYVDHRVLCQQPRAM